jgi:hypothetical protein
MPQLLGRGFSSLQVSDEGHELHDWLQAESELTQHKAKGFGA